ncbi:MAG: hypothetical protein N2484_04845 [Clostridia bacterium]|nr:hypothetical protein [Clostridia bacterium]
MKRLLNTMHICLFFKEKQAGALRKINPNVPNETIQLAHWAHGG